MQARHAARTLHTAVFHASLQFSRFAVCYPGITRPRRKRTLNLFRRKKAEQGNENAPYQEQPPVAYGYGPSFAPPPEEDGYFTPAAMGQQAFIPPPQQGNANPDYFAPAQGQAAPQAPQFSAYPPPYQGPLQQPDPSAYYGPNAMQAPSFGAPPPQMPGSNVPPDSEKPERIPYRAAPKQKSMMIYLYLSLAVLVIVLGAMGLSQLLDPKQSQTALVTLSGQDSTYSGNALIVRNETVFSQAGVSTIRYTAEEGARVSRGTPVCTVYTTGFSSKEMTTLQKYRKALKEHEMALLEAETSPDTKLQRLDTTVLERAAETQALIRGAHGNLLNQEELLKEAVSERQTYIKQKYPDDTKLTRLLDNENNQLQRIDTWTKQYASADDGIVSFYTDGFEGALNASNYLTYTPQQVQAMLKGEIPGEHKKDKDTSDIYRLVRQHSWSALMLADNTDWTPVVGDTYQMLVESFESTTASAVVEGVTKAGGQLLVRLKIESNVQPMLYTRSCRLQLSKSTITYSVPAKAIINQGGVIGVVAMFAEGDYLIPVNVISQDATQANIVPINAGYLYEGMTVRLFNR